MSLALHERTGRPNVSAGPDECCYYEVCADVDNDSDGVYGCQIDTSGSADPTG